MQAVGNLKKMRVMLKPAKPTQYTLIMGEEVVDINAHLGQTLTLSYTGKINCIQCGRRTNKSFQQGYCFPCLRRLQECNLCIIHPERCQVEQGTCPQDDWAHQQCAQAHVVYLANSSGLKVGITREENVPSRWIDQGAMQALTIYKTTNRYQAGLLEMVIKKYISDRTNWRDMLKNNVKAIDLLAERDKLLARVNHDIAPLLSKYHNAIRPMHDAKLVSIQYPVIHYPTKINSLSLDKKPVIEGKLLGIKGQYLILDCGVLNIRKFGGYEVTLTNQGLIYAKEILT